MAVFRFHPEHRGLSTRLKVVVVVIVIVVGCVLVVVVMEVHLSLCSKLQFSTQKW